MIRCRTSYSSYPQDLWKRLLILRKLAIGVREDPACSKIEQHFEPHPNLSPSKSVRLVSLFSINCALMNERFAKCPVTSPKKPDLTDVSDSRTDPSLNYPRENHE